MDKLKYYVDMFNADDEEHIDTLIKNCDAYSFLKEQIPLLECPDENIEKTYYFRWWTFRKHLIKTDKGHIFSEFITYKGAINAGLGFHISEAKWYKDKTFVQDYIRYWFDHEWEVKSYSIWFAFALYEYCSHINDFSLATDNLDKLLHYYSVWEETHFVKDVGMFWSIDDRDAMEYSISGSNEVDYPIKGFRPTLNSYMAIDAWAISQFAKMAGKTDLSEKYYKKYETLKAKLNRHLWDGEFFKAMHSEDENGNPILGAVPKRRNARELIGYVPWMFSLADKGREQAFKYLKSKEHFLNKYGFTTAEQNHERYLFLPKSKHSCLWNGYIWPFATSQTLLAMLNLIKNYEQDIITKEDFYSALSTFASSHRLVRDDGRKVMWIDESMDPRDGSWYTRCRKKEKNWDRGYETGKDYNHSSFCDIVLSGLLGISPKDGGIEVNPLIPENWDWFKVENLNMCGNTYSVYYDKTGNVYNKGKGITVEKY